MPERDTRIKRERASYEIVVRGTSRTPISDFYHALLRLPWWATFVTIAVSFLLANLVFAVGYYLSHGIANTERGSFLDAFFFSVQTMGTIGYGAMYPHTTLAHTLVVAESIASLILTALATGLVFAKFSRSTARVAFSRFAVISPHDDVPTLAIRVGNERSNQIVNAEVRVSLSQTKTTREGRIFYRVLDLKLARDRILSLSRSWTVLHRIDETSPLYGMTPEQFSKEECEFAVMIVGTDDTSMQPAHASTQYFVNDVLWGARYADVLSEMPDGNLLLDLTRFNDVEPKPATESFQYTYNPN